MSMYKFVCTNNFIVYFYFVVTDLGGWETLFCAQVNLNVSCGSVFAAQSKFICLEFNVISYLSMIYNLVLILSPSTRQEFRSIENTVRKKNSQEVFEQVYGGPVTVNI